MKRGVVFNPSLAQCEACGVIKPRTTFGPFVWQPHRPLVCLSGEECRARSASS